MPCDWGHDDCRWEGKKCSGCILESFYYEPPEAKPRRRMKQHQDKADGRMGSNFEFANHKVMAKVFGGSEKEVNVGMTLNSGATIKEKGDEQVSGLVNIMEELKTQEPDRKGGTKSFSIQRKWLDKLHREAMAEGKEMWWLKFAFSEPEGEAGRTFIVLEQDQILSLALMVRNNRARQKVAEAKEKKLEAELGAAKAEIQRLQAQISYMNRAKDLEELQKKLYHNV